MRTRVFTRLCPTAARAGAAGQPPLFQGRLELMAGRLGCLVVLHPVQQLLVETLGAGADRALAAAVDQCHQRADVAGAAGEEVVGQVVREHAGVLVGQHQALFEGQQQLPPFAAAALGVDGERTHAQAGGATAGLGQSGVA